MNSQTKLPICTIAIVVVNIVVFLILSNTGEVESGLYMMRHGAMYVPAVLAGDYYTLVTSMFLHFSFPHLFNNMLLLLVLGRYVEEEAGKIKFLIIYFFGGIAGNVLSMLMDINSGEFAVSAGASGAIFGLIGALIYMAIYNHGHIADLSQRGLMFMAVLSLYFGFTSSGVDNFAHLGGLIGGFFISVLVYRKRNDKNSAFGQF